MKKFQIFTLILLLFGSSCEYDSNDFFPSIVGLKWVYSIIIKSSYTGKSDNKRIMITNHSKEKKGKITELSKLYSDGSLYSYEIEKNRITRSSVILAFSDGIDEPIKKIIYPDTTFKQKEWTVREQLFLVRGFQPPLRNAKPRSQFDMKYKISNRYKNYEVKNFIYNDCIEIEGSGTTNFIGDTRSGPIEVKINNVEILCDGVGLVKQIRSEKTDASAFGNMTLSKSLLSFE